MSCRKRTSRLTEEFNIMKNICLGLLAFGIVTHILIGSGLGYYSSIAFSQNKPTKKPPNIVWMVLDDATLTLGAYGDAQAVAPNMDRQTRQ